MTQDVTKQIIARLTADTDSRVVSGPVKVVFAKREPLTFKSAAAKGSWEFKRDTGTRTSMRAGHYGITILADDVGVCKQFVALVPDDSVQPGSRFWDALKSDRLDQLKRTERALIQYKHPMLDEVMRDVKAERAKLSQE